MKIHDRALIEKDIEAYLEQHRTKELLPFLTCGSVDDGKSTLIGRLLHDTKMIYEDQFAAVERDSKKYGTTGDEIDLALLTDGLQAEREQGITIDVAYRYFSTSKRKFIIADAPGHEQYTRNMATGASNCNLAIILVDARYGVLPQTRRHSFIATLLGIKHLVVAINKMDLVDYNQDRYEEIKRDFSDFAAKLDVRDILFIPMSALKGDNVVTQGDNMPWYSGAPLLNHLENVHIAGDRNLIDMRFPVQYVMRPHLDFRGYAGTIASGVLNKGREVLVLPSGKTSKIRSIVTWEGEVEEAFAPMSVVATLEDEIDVSRGDILVYPKNRPRVANRFEAMLVAMYEEPISPDRPYLLKHSNVITPAAVTGIEYRVDINTMHREKADELALNEIGRVRVETNRPLAFDPYTRNHHTGAFILIDRLTNATVAAGMILDRGTEDEDKQRHREAEDAGRDVLPVHSHVTLEQRIEATGQRPFALWLTGLPRAGKSSVAFGVEKALFERGLHNVVTIDGANLRTGINRDLGFSGLDRAENVRRAGELAKFVCDSGQIAIVAMVSPFAADRAQAREVVGAARFLEVLCDAPVEVCEARDDSGLYARARAGTMVGFTGIDGPYERPEAPDLVLDTEDEALEESVENVIQHLGRLDLL